MTYTPGIDQLIESLRCLPGVGPKSAQRIAFHLLERDREGARRIAHALEHAVEKVGHCHLCRNFSETELCGICENPKRDQSLLCIVETPGDVASIEQAADYRGVYFVLMGHLSPLDGITPEDIGLGRLQEILREKSITEVILATGTTPEGEATAHYISEMVRDCSIRVSRIAHGVPLGGELEFVDSNTLSHAISRRRDI